MIGQVQQSLDRARVVAFVKPGDNLFDEVRAQKVGGVVRRRDRYVTGTRARRAAGAEDGGSGKLMRPGDDERGAGGALVGRFAAARQQGAEFVGGQRRKERLPEGVDFALEADVAALEPRGAC